MRDAVTLDRLRALVLALSADAFQRVAIAFGIPFAGEVLRDDAADELLDALLADGRSGVSTFFGAIPAPELRRLVRSLRLPSPTNKKDAFATTLIYDFLLSSPEPPLLELLIRERFAPTIDRPGTAYGILDRHFDKRGLQRLLDHLAQPRSGKNKRVLIRRIFESFLWLELA